VEGSENVRQQCAGPTAQQALTIAPLLALVWRQTPVCFKQSLKIKLLFFVLFMNFYTLIRIPISENIQNPKILQHVKLTCKYE
jgi:hypothetical protein